MTCLIILQFRVRTWTDTISFTSPSTPTAPCPSGVPSHFISKLSRTLFNITEASYLPLSASSSGTLGRVKIRVSNASVSRARNAAQGLKDLMGKPHSLVIEWLFQVVGPRSLKAPKRSSRSPRPPSISTSCLPPSTQQHMVTIKPINQTPPI